MFQQQQALLVISRCCACRCRCEPWRHWDASLGVEGMEGGTQCAGTCHHGLDISQGRAHERLHSHGDRVLVVAPLLQHHRHLLLRAPHTQCTLCGQYTPQPPFHNIIVCLTCSACSSPAARAWPPCLCRDPPLPPPLPPPLLLRDAALRWWERDASEPPPPSGGSVGLVAGDEDGGDDEEVPSAVRSRLGAKTKSKHVR